MLHATRIALIQILQARLADEQAMMKKLRDRYIELDIERFAAELEAMDW
jgi:predicted double-glycine peptidase